MAGDPVAEQTILGRDEPHSPCKQKEHQIQDFACCDDIHPSRALLPRRAGTRKLCAMHLTDLQLCACASPLSAPVTLQPAAASSHLKVSFQLTICIQGGKEVCKNHELKGKHNSKKENAHNPIRKKSLICPLGGNSPSQPRYQGTERGAAGGTGQWKPR